MFYVMDIDFLPQSFVKYFLFCSLALYHQIDIYSPTREAITILFKSLPVVTDEDATYQLYYQTHFLEVLFGEVNERVNLLQWKINNIARVIGRINKHIKKKRRSKKRKRFITAFVANLISFSIYFRTRLELAGCHGSGT